MDGIKSGSVWTAYTGKIEKGKSEFYELEVHNDSPKKVKQVAQYQSEGNYKKYFYYQYTDREYIEQTEDGRRGITNPTIKQMFKIRKYYIYDGTEERAKAIYEDWNGLITDSKYDFVSEYDIDGTMFFEKYHDSNSTVKIERALEYALDEYYYYNSGPLASEGDPRKKSLIGNITINKDTLNAFSILENTHTLDADYQYRDFKELVVELDYFDKEDLSDKPDEVFEWIIPDYKEKWPVRLIDKSDTYYGTLIHSDKGVTKLKEDLEITDPTTDPTADPDATETTDESISEIQSITGYTPDLDIVSPVTGEVIGYGTYKRVNTDVVASYEDEGKTEAILKQEGVALEEEVGYIQIKVLENKDIIKDSAKLKEKIEDTEHEFSKTDIWNAYYEEYEEICEGYVITIEGIKLLDGVTSLDQLIANPSVLTQSDKIQANVTPNLVDDDKEEKNQAKENLKLKLDNYAIVPTVDEGDKLYIKEGTIIGTTTYSTEFEDYSYMRMVLRDEKLAVVENVEDYFKLAAEMQILATGDISAQVEALKAAGVPDIGSLADSDTRKQVIAQYMPIINKYSAEYGVDPYLVVAMICGESSGRVDADNGCAYGLMQWEYATGRTSITVTKADGTEETITGITKEGLIAGGADFQIKAGIAELKEKLDEFDGNLAVALQGYNYGSAGVRYCIGHYMATSGKYGVTPNPSDNYYGVSSEKMKEYIASGDTGWLSSREWYTSTGHNHFGAGGGTASYISGVLRYYSTTGG